MGALWIWLAIIAAGEAVMLSDEEYYQMPTLFQLDDYEECLTRPNGAFCLGTFQLADRSNKHLMRLITQHTSDPYNFNRTRMHRGLCVSTSCAHIHYPHLPDRFEACVDNVTRSRYGLEARLLNLDYCETKDTPPSVPLDGVDLGFACIVLIILTGNMIGTAYDLLRNQENKPNRYLLPWSLRENWRRLTATYKPGDQRVRALDPIHGMKAMTLMFVMLAHSVIVYHITYLYNPRFLEVASRHPLTTILHNGSVIVQTFFMLSSFLVAHNLLVYADSEPKAAPGLRLFPKLVLQRFARITPVHMFIVGVAATWWRFASTGPLWSLVEAESARCRSKWWAQALYLHNFIRPDEKCLLQTWFLAVDMQLYVVSAFLTLALVRWPQRAVRVLAALLVAAIAANYVIAYTWDLKPILFVTYPELMRHQYTDEASFKWLYAAPWGSLPTSLLGLLVAFGYHHVEKEGIKLQDKMWFRVLCRLAIPGILAAIMAGYVVRNATSREAVALYAALDRPLFTVIVAIAMIGFFYRIDEVVWRLMSWDGWAVLSRMSLSVLMVHWEFNLTQMAIKNSPSHASVYEIGGHWCMTMLMTYVTALPLYLLVEQPLHGFLRVLV